jgi:hypothetical protein
MLGVSWLCGHCWFVISSWSGICLGSGSFLWFRKMVLVLVGFCPIGVFEMNTHSRFPTNAQLASPLFSFHFLHFLCVHVYNKKRLCISVMQIMERGTARLERRKTHYPDQFLFLWRICVAGLIHILR